MAAFSIIIFDVKFHTFKSCYFIAVESPKWILRRFCIQYPVPYPCGTKQLFLPLHSRLWVEEGLSIEDDDLLRIHNFMSLCRERKQDAENRPPNCLSVDVLGSFVPIGFKHAFERFYFDHRLPNYWNMANGRSFNLFSAWEIVNNTPLKELTAASRFLCRWVFWLFICLN